MNIANIGCNGATPPRPTACITLQRFENNFMLPVGKAITEPLRPSAAQLRRFVVVAIKS
jgi:hypothetical protein